MFEFDYFFTAIVVTDPSNPDEKELEDMYDEESIIFLQGNNISCFFRLFKSCFNFISILMFTLSISILLYNTHRLVPS